jgi:hypothetical protein
MSINGSTASFLPFTINGLTDASFSNSNLGVATATSLTLTSATPLKLARFDLDKNLVSASVDESEVAVLTSNVFNGTQTMKPGFTTNINNVIETNIIANPPYDKSSFTTSGISGYTAPLGTLTGPSSGEYSISQTASDRSIMALDSFIPEVGRKYVYSFTMRIIDAPEAYVSVEQGGVQRSNTIIQIGSDNETISDTFTFDPSGSTLIFKIYTGSTDPWTATWSSFSLGYYEASINAPINNLTVNNLATELLTFPSTSTNSESWSVYSISTMGNPSTLGGLVFQEASLGVGAFITGGVIGATSFQFNTLSGNAGKVVVTNADQVMSTTINASQLNFITALTSQAADSITTGSNKITQEYNATVGDISTLVNRATLDAGLALVPNLIPLNNIWTGTNQFNQNVSTGGTARFLQPYNATSLDISTLVNRATLDGAIAGLGAGILTLNNTWTGTNTFNSTITVGAEYTANLNGGLRTLQNATQFNPSLDANSYFVTGVSPTTYVFSTNWIVNPVSGTTANIALDPAVFYFDANHKYVISFTGIYGTGATWVGTVFNNSTSTTVSDASIAITTSPQNLTMTFTAGSSNPAIYLRFVGASGTLRWTNFTIKEVDLQILGNIVLSSEIDSNIVQSNGRTANLAGGLKVNQTSVATATSLTTASLPAGVTASSLSGSYTLTATAGGTTFGMWLGSSFTYIAGAKYTFTFTGFSTNATATQAMIMYVNTYTGGSGTFIGDYIVNVPITSSTVSGSFTATSNNNVVFNFVSSATGRSISFTGFTLTRADTEITAITTLPRITGTATAGLGLNASNQIVTTSVAPNFSAVSVGSVPYESATDTFSNSLITQGTTDLGYTGASFTASTGIASITFSSPTYSANSNASVQGIINLPALPSIVVGLPCIATITASTFPVFAVAPYPYFTLTNGATVVYTSPVGSPGTVSMPFTPTSTTLFITLYFKAPPTGFTGSVFTWTNFVITTPSMTTTGFSNTTGRETVGQLVVSGTADVAGNITQASGTFRKNVASWPNTWLTMTGGDGFTSPFMEFWFGSLRRGYIGNATASVFQLASENNCDFNLITGGSVRMIATNAGDIGIGRTPGYKFDVGGSMRVKNVLNADDSMCYYGENASWNSRLVVGAGTDKAGASTAQVITTNGNLHLDGGNNNSIYYGYYADTRGTPNTHIFYGLPQNGTSSSQVAVFEGNTLKRSQAVNKLVYFSNNVAWGGGVQMSYSFYLYNTACSVQIWGKNSGYYSGAGMMQTTIRVYSQSAGTYYYYPINAFVNNGYNHFTVPLNYAASFPYTGWYDIFVYSTSGWITDGNDQLTIGVTVLPAGSF